MNVRQAVKAAPATALVICGTVVVVSIIGAVTAATLVGKNSDDLFRLINIIVTAAGGVASTGAVLYASAGAKKGAETSDKVDAVAAVADKIKDQTGTGS